MMELPYRKRIVCEKLFTSEWGKLHEAHARWIERPYLLRLITKGLVVHVEVVAYQAAHLLRVSTE